MHQEHKDWDSRHLDNRQTDRWETFFTTFNKTLSTMYASFLLKYSKSYLHTCIIFLYVYSFFFLQCHARGRVTSLSRFRYTPFPTHVSKTFHHFLPFSLSIYLLLLSINQRFLSSARFVRHRSSTMNTMRYASAIREQEKKKEK